MDKNQIKALTKTQKIMYYTGMTLFFGFFFYYLLTLILTIIVNW